MEPYETNFCSTLYLYVGLKLESYKKFYLGNMFMLAALQFAKYKIAYLIAVLQLFNAKI